MSMILDALTRAEHERQLERQPDFKFVTPVKPQKKNPNKIWLWVGLVALANVLILFFVIRALSGDVKNEMEMAVVDPEKQQPIVVQTPVMSKQTSQLNPQVTQEAQQHETQPLSQETDQLAGAENTAQQQISQNTMPSDVRPLAMEINSAQAPEVDRPLIYESKQPNAKPKISALKPSVNLANAPAADKGNVSFSSSELSSDDTTPIINKPKLLIDQGQEQSVSNSRKLTDVIKVRDLPESSRSNLSQYEVNVHVFDDDPIRRFVLINMDKYKEGDRIINNGPLVEAITPAGVVVDYGNGRALLPPN